MPKYHMRDELKEMPGEYRQGKRHSKEDPGTYRQRMIDYLEEEPDELVLKNVLPEKLGKYRIDAGQQEERKQLSRRMREKKVYAYTAQVGRQDPEMPSQVMQIRGVIHDYLLSIGQEELDKEYEEVMTLSTETIEEAAQRILTQDTTGEMDQEDARNEALDEQHQKRYDRGAMFMKLLEPLKGITPEFLEDLSDEEAEKNYVKYHTMLELVIVLRELLKKADDDGIEIFFTEDQKRIGQEMLDYLEPLMRIENQTDLICNPYYQCLDTKAISKSLDAKGSLDEFTGVFKGVDDTLNMLGGDLDSTVRDSRREAIRRMHAELRKNAINPDTAIYTRMVMPEEEQGETGINTAKAQEERFDPESLKGTNYIYGGGKFFVTQNDRQVEMCVKLDRQHDGMQRENTIYCELSHNTAVLKIKKAVSRMGFSGRIRYSYPEGGALNLKDPDTIEYLYNGGKVIVTADNAEVILSVNGKNNYQVSKKFTPGHALIKTREWLQIIEIPSNEADYTREDGTTIDLENPDDLNEFCAGTAVIVTYGNKQVRLTYDAKKHSVVSEYTERHKENQAIEQAAGDNESSWEARDIYKQLGHSYKEGLKAVYDLVKDADPALLKSSEQYKSMRRSLKELKEYMKQNAIEEPGSQNAKENRRRLKELTAQVFHAANAYITYKGEGGTDFARRRVAAAKAVKEFANHQLNQLDQLAMLDIKLQTAEGKESLEVLLNRRNLNDAGKFREAGRKYALGEGKIVKKEKIAKNIYFMLGEDKIKDLYHNLELDMPGDRKTVLSKRAQAEAEKLMGYMVIESVYREDLKKYSADQTEKSPLTQLIEKDNISTKDMLKLVTETPAFQRQLNGLTRAGLYRFVTDPGHTSLKNLAEAVRGQVTQASADKAVESARQEAMNQSRKQSEAGRVAKPR